MKKYSVFNMPHWANAALFILSVTLLIFPALYNGFPLVYPDTGMYIDSGHTGLVPVASPLMYGLFVRHISMSASLWPVIVIQGLITMGAIALIAGIFWRDTWQTKTLLLTIVMAVFTAASNFASQIMPDFLTAIMLLCISSLLLYHGKSWLFFFIPGILILFACSAHLSNLLILPPLLMILFFAKLILRKQLPGWRRIALLAGVTAFCWLFVPTFNYFKGAGFDLSNTNNIRVMGRLSETGVLSEYLRDNCEKKDIPLCDYIDDFPMHSDVFLWHASPLYNGQEPRFNTDSIWLQKNAEYDPVVKDILTTPKYAAKVAWISIDAAVRQLGNISIEKLPPMMEGSPVLPQIKWRFPGDVAAYTSSRQARETLTFPVTGMIQTIAVILAAVGIIIISAMRKLRRKLDARHLIMLGVTLAGVLINAWACTVFSTPALRYQSRVAWLIPFIFSVFLIIVLQKEKTTNHNTKPTNDHAPENH